MTNQIGSWHMLCTITRQMTLWQGKKILTNYSYKSTHFQQYSSIRNLYKVNPFKDTLLHAHSWRNTLTRLKIKILSWTVHAYTSTYKFSSVNLSKIVLFHLGESEYKLRGIADQSNAFSVFSLHAGLWTHLLWRIGMLIIDGAGDTMENNIGFENHPIVRLTEEETMNY